MLLNVFAFQTKYDFTGMGTYLFVFSIVLLAFGFLTFTLWPVQVRSENRRPLVVAAVSCESKIRDTRHNLERIAEWSKRAAAQGAHLVLFPECTIQGWWQSRENRRLAETIEGESFCEHCCPFSHSVSVVTSRKLEEDFPVNCITAIPELVFFLVFHKCFRGRATDSNQIQCGRLALQ